METDFEKPGTILIWNCTFFIAQKVSVIIEECNCNKNLC